MGTSISGYWTSAPDGYLLEDGTAVSRTTYADLFAAIGTTYGSGDGSTTFNLPDSRGRVSVNKNPSDTEFDTIGEKYGEKAHTLTGAESGEKGHNHTQNQHIHVIIDNTLRMVPSVYDPTGWTNYFIPTNSGNVSNDFIINNFTTTTNNAVAASNASSAHNTIQPSIVKMFAIKYRQPTTNNSMLSPATSVQGYWSTAPTGYLLEDGTAVSRTTYADLFAAIGTTYGSGDGSTTFNLPDSRGRVSVNKNPSDTEFDVIGEKYGEKTHLNTSSESGIKGHNHTQNAHDHTIRDHTGRGVASVYGNTGGTASFIPTNSGNISNTGITNSFTTATNQAVSASNASVAHNNIQPSIVKVFAIKYTPTSGVIDTKQKGTTVQGYWSTAPTGYLLEDGTAVSRTTYADLFAVIGTTYGAGDGSTTFNLPDSRGRVSVNKNPSDTEFDTIGEKYGEKAHTLTGAESGEKGHNHTQNAHDHTIRDHTGRGVASVYGNTGGTASFIPTNSGNVSNDFIKSDFTTATNQAVPDTNASSAHNTIQPSIVQNFAIRY